MTDSKEGLTGQQSKFESIKARNGQLNIVSEVFSGAFAEEIKTPEEIRDFVRDLEGDIKGNLSGRLTEDRAKEEAREIAGSLVGQTLGLDKDNHRSSLWLRALEETPHFNAVKVAYITYSSIRTR